MYHSVPFKAGQWDNMEHFGTVLEQKWDISVQEWDTLVQPSGCAQSLRAQGAGTRATPYRLIIALAFATCQEFA